jgi:hypothetical protein
METRSQRVVMRFLMSTHRDLPEYVRADDAKELFGRVNSRQPRSSTPPLHPEVPLYLDLPETPRTPCAASPQLNQQGGVSAGTVKSSIPRPQNRAKPCYGIGLETVDV